MRTALLIATLALALPAQASPHTLAVAYFDNNSGDAQYDPLRKGLADMLITDLFTLSSLKVVEREKLNAVVDELKLGQTKLVDKTTAVKMGKLLSAEYVLTGGLTVSKQTLRLDARVFKVEDGGMVATRRVEGSTEDFFSVEKDLVDALVKDLSLQVAPGERSKLRRNQTQSFAAFSTYSRALDAQDLGNVEEAARLFQAALDADPGYASAKTHLERMAALLKVARTQQAGRVDSELATAKKRKDPAFMAAQFESMAYLAGHRANRKAAQELFRLIATRVPAK